MSWWDEYKKKSGFPSSSNSGSGSETGKDGGSWWDEYKQKTNFPTQNMTAGRTTYTVHIDTGADGATGSVRPGMPSRAEAGKNPSKKTIMLTFDNGGGYDDVAKRYNEIIGGVKVTQEKMQGLYSPGSKIISAETNAAKQQATQAYDELAALIIYIDNNPDKFTKQERDSLLQTIQQGMTATQGVGTAAGFFSEGNTWQNPITGKTMLKLNNPAPMTVDRNGDGETDSVGDIEDVYFQRAKEEKSAPMVQKALELYGTTHDEEFDGKTKQEQRDEIYGVIGKIENYFMPTQEKKQGSPLNPESVIPDWKTRKEDPQEAKFLWNQLQNMLEYVMYSGNYSEDEAKQIADRVYQLKEKYFRRYPENKENNGLTLHNVWYNGDYENQAQNDKMMSNAVGWRFGETAADFMQEWRYQSGGITRENIIYAPTDELIKRAFGKSGSVDNGAMAKDAENMQQVGRLYLANKPMTEEEITKFNAALKKAVKDGTMTQQEADELTAIRTKNGTEGNAQGILDALNYRKERGAEMIGTGMGVGSEIARDSIFTIAPEALSQWITHMAGYTEQGVAGILGLMGFDEEAQKLGAKGEASAQWVNPELTEWKQYDYNLQRDYTDVLNGVQNKTLKWVYEMVPGMTASALQMAASAVAGGAMMQGAAPFMTAYAPAANAGSRALNASNYSAGIRAMKYGVENAKLFAMAGNAALNTYAEVSEDNRLNEAQKTLYALADGAAEFFTEKLFDGNPLLDDGEAGVFTKWLYNVTNDGTYDSITKSWLDVIKGRAWKTALQKFSQSKAMDLLGEGLEEVLSSIGMMGVDYAMYGKTDVTPESLANDFASGLLLSMILSGGQDLIQAFAPIDKNGDYRKIKYFTEAQQAEKNALDAQMAVYTLVYMAGDVNAMRNAGLSEEQALKAAKDYNRIRGEYTQAAGMINAREQVAAEQAARNAEKAENTLPPQSLRDSSPAEQGSHGTEDAETMIRAASPELGGVDSRTFIPEKAAEDAQAVFDLYGNLEESGVLQADKDAAASMARIATTALTSVQNAQAFGMMRVEDGTVYETGLQNCIDGAKGYMTQVQSAPVQNSSTMEMPVQQTAPANTNDGGMNNGATTGTEILEGRDTGMGTDGQTGAVGEVAAATGRQRSDAAEIARAVASGQAERKSAKSLGIDGGSTHDTMNVLPDETVARIPSLQRIRAAVEQEGATAVFFTGKLEVWNKSGKRFDSIEGLRRIDDSGNVTYIIKADGISRNAEQIYYHEYLHGVIQNDRAKLLDLALELEQKIGRAGVEKMVAQYVDAYKGIYGTITESMTADEIADLEMKYIEEIFADAYAQIRRGNINNSAAVSVVENQRGSIERAGQNRTATDRTNGPNEQRYSFAGTKAKFADMSALEKAKAMEEENASSEEIRQQTGWFKGYDGKWRFEINDEDMKIDLKGNFMSNPDVRRYNELFEKAYLYDTAKENELKELQILEKNLEGVRKTPKYLGEYVQHDALFKAYPELKNIEVVFVGNEGSADGAYHSGFNEIALKRNLRLDQKRLKSVLIHEIQHAIQSIEGFADGASVSYWDEQRENNRVNDDRSSRQLYRDTAGEVEARDVQSRMDMTAEQRKNTRPDIDRTDAVFADGNSVSSSSDVDYLPAAEKYRDGTATEAEIEQLRKMVDEAAKKAMPNTKVVDENGNPIVVYHGTPHGGFTVFDMTRNGKRGSFISSRLGTFFSSEKWYADGFAKSGGTESDIENGFPERQVYECYLNIKNPLRVFSLEMTSEGDVAEIEDKLKKGNYDGIIDEIGSFVVFNQSQIKSADLVTYDDNGNIIPLSERFNQEKEDIRYSFEDDVAELDEGYQRSVERDAAEDEPTGKNGSVLPQRQSTEPDYENISFEIMEQRAKDASLQQLRQMAKSAEVRLNRYRWAERNHILTDQMKAKMQATKTAVEIYNEQLKTKNAEEKARRKKQQQEDAQQQKPKEAKKRLKASLAEMYSIPAGSRKMANELIENLANKMIQTGKVTNEDRTALMDALFRAGVVNVAPEGYYGEIRSYVQHGRIYVPEEVRAEFGDDWGAFRKQASGNRIYLTNDTQDMGIDVWNADLANMFPGGFDEMGTDRRAMLENIVRLAEEGRTENLTIAEMMKRVQDNEGITVEDQMDALDEQAINALETFAREANLEVKIRREGAYKVLAERQKYRSMIERESAARRNREIRNEVMRQIQQLNRKRRRTAPEIQAQIDETLRWVDTVARSISDQGLENLQALATEYEKAKDDPNFIPSPYIEARLARLQQTQLDDMSIEDVTELGRMVSAIATTIENRNKLLAKEFNADIDRIAAGAISEMKASAGSKGGNFYKWTTEEHLSPVRFLKHLGGWVENGTMHTIAQSLENGQTKQMQYLMEASKMFDSFIDNKENQKWMQSASGKNAEWISVDVPVGYEDAENGQKIKWQNIEITPMMRVALLMHSQNYDNLRHIQGGGITIPNKALYLKGEMKEAYAKGARVKMSPETVRAIVKDATAQERAFAGYLKKYYNEFSKEHINEVSMRIDGFERAAGDNYYHIKTDPNFLAKLPDQVAKDISLESIGSIVNERVHAQNPIMLEDASVSLADHMEQISKYYGFAVPIRDFTAIMNHTSHETKNIFSGSVKEVMARQWGAGAQKYLDNLMADLQGTTGINEMAATFLSSLRGKLAGASLMFNAAVAISQTASYPGAMQTMGAKALLEGLKVWEKVDTSLIEKYSPLLWYRNQGNSTQELGDYMSDKTLEQKLPWLLGWIQKMDSATIRRLWAASEYKVRNETDLAPGNAADIAAGSDEFYQKVADVFNRAVYDTQPNYSTMQRPQILRSKSDLTKALTMFKTVPLQYYNMMYEAVGRVTNAVKRGDKAEIAQAKKYCANTMVGLLGANTVYVVMKALIKSLRFKGDQYKDDEGEFTAESILKGLGLDLMDTYAGSIIGGTELLDIIERIIPSLMEGEYKQYNGTEISALSIITDLVNDIERLTSGIGKTDGTDIASGAKELAKDLVMVSLGLPAENIETYLLALTKWISPETAERYETLFEDRTKADLSEESGRYLEAGISVYMDNRTENLTDEVKAELLSLWEDGQMNALPNAVPNKVNINSSDDEDVADDTDDADATDLTKEQKQAYRDKWSEIVSPALPELMQTEAYINADASTRAAMIEKLYAYADQIAKKNAVEEFKVKTWAAFGETTDRITDYIVYKTMDSKLSKDSTDEFAAQAVENIYGFLTEEISDEDSEEVARLYLSGYDGLIPKNAPNKITYTTDDVEHEVALSVEQQKQYNEKRKEIIGSELSALMSMQEYAEANDKMRAKMINNVFKFANQVAKEELVNKAPADNWVKNGLQDMEDGVTLAEYAAYRAEKSKLTGKDDDGESEDGLQNKRIIELIDSYDWTEEQKLSVYLDSCTDTKIEKMNALKAAGMTWNQIKVVAAVVGTAVKPKLYAIDSTDAPESVKAKAFEIYASKDQLELFRTGVRFGVPIKYYAEVLKNADTNGSGRVDMDEATAYIKNMALPPQQAAYLWQMVTDAGKKGKNNPFSSRWGVEFYGEAHAND